jgi:hypothetical protein
MTDTLTFAEAMAMDPSEVEASWGSVWMTVDKCADSGTLADFRCAKFRRAKPKRSRVQEMEFETVYERTAAEYAIRAVCEWLGSDQGPDSVDAMTVRAIEREFLVPR